MNMIDWKTGVYNAPDLEAEKSTFRVTIASDWCAFREFADLMERDPLAVYGDLLPLFRESDLNIVNVECALGHKGTPIKKAGPNIRSTDKSEQGLAKVPFHLATLANNHIMDFGAESLEETIGILRAAGLKTVGAGMDLAEITQPAIVPMGNAALGVIDCAEGEACASISGQAGANPFDIPAVLEQIRALKKEVDAVVVIFHGGREYLPSPPPYVVDALRRFAEAGAAAVIAHHPHVPQGIEIHNGVPIVYSQGNFVFPQRSPDGSTLYFKRTGYLVHLDFAGKNLQRFSITPYRVKSNGLFTLQGDEKVLLLRELESVSAHLANPREIHQLWDAAVDELGQEWAFSSLRSALKLVEQDAELGAAKMHNLFYCPAHNEARMNALKRISLGELGDSPEWAKKLVVQWRDRPIDE